MKTADLTRMFTDRPTRLARLAPIGVIALLLMTSLSLCMDARAERLSPQEEAAWIETLREDIAVRGLDFEVSPNPLTQIPWEEFRDHYLGLRLPEGHLMEDRRLEDLPTEDHRLGDRLMEGHRLEVQQLARLPQLELWARRWAFRH